MSNGAGVVLDASAVLALLQDEPGAKRIAEVLDTDPGGRLVMSVVNLAEVYWKVRCKGGSVAAVAQALQRLRIELFHATEEDARSSATIVATAESKGISLGDRCCLALGARLGFPVLTTDQRWARLKVPMLVILAR